MRPAYNDTQFIQDENGALIGVNLGYDFCAEHEWGVRGIKRALGVWTGDETTESKVWGFDRVRVTKSDSIQFFQHKIKFVKSGNKRATLNTIYVLALLEADPWDSEEKRLEYVKDHINRGSGYRLESEGLAASWNENAFAIWCTEEHKEKLELLYHAFKSNNILLGMMRQNEVFSGSGLFFGIETLCSPQEEQLLIDAQKEYFRMCTYFRMWKQVYKTKILDRLKAAGCKYFACSPKRIQFKSIVHAEKYGEKDVAKRQRSSKLPDIMFWLNPMEQQKNNCGWFTLEELEQWIQGGGPIPMKRNYN